ncbi:MAG TPA: pyridoxamine 5'-phosphate oxidase family protein [Gemmatimonadaceae bacterium]|nr:pyridoxamine 5'-phosphate oxidase family protein [Gemmatimonadaceae bacterium]
MKNPTKKRARTKASASESAAPKFRALSRAECESLLERNKVGRLAFTFHDRVDIEPVHYLYADGWLHGRTSTGTKVATLLHHPWVAFEVDEVQGLFDWQSVVVHGAVYIPDVDGSASDRSAYMGTLELIRELVPDALEESDPTPARQVLFRIHVDEMTGRESKTG